MNDVKHGLNRFLARLDAIQPTEPDPPQLLGDDARRAYEDAEEKRLGTHLERCGVPASLRNLLAIGLDAENYPATKYAREWTARPDACFLLLGGAAGSGKTTAAVECLRLARSPYYGHDFAGQTFSSWRYDSARGLFTTAVDLADKASWSEAGGRLWARAQSAAWLVLDDLGSEAIHQNGPWMSDFQNLISHRHASGLRSVITTNLDSKTLRARYGVRVVDRLLEKGVAYNAGNESRRARLQ